MKTAIQIKEWRKKQNKKTATFIRDVISIKRTLICFRKQSSDRPCLRLRLQTRCKPCNSRLRTCPLNYNSFPCLTGLDISVCVGLLC